MSGQSWGGLDWISGISLLALSVLATSLEAKFFSMGLIRIIGARKQAESPVDWRKLW